MDYLEYHNQAIKWRLLKPKTWLPKLVYSVAHADVVDYVTNAIETPNDWYLSDSPFGGPIVPPSFFYNEYSRLLAAANMPIGILNTKMSFKNKNVILHGQEVTLVGYFEKMYEKKGRIYSEVKITVTNDEGKEACGGVITLIIANN